MWKHSINMEILCYSLYTGFFSLVSLFTKNSKILNFAFIIGIQGISLAEKALLTDVPIEAWHRLCNFTTSLARSESAWSAVHVAVISSKIGGLELLAMV